MSELFDPERHEPLLDEYTMLTIFGSRVQERLRQIDGSQGVQWGRPHAAGDRYAYDRVTLANGQTAFASARLSAWHQLGTVTQNTMSAQEIMGAALLGNWGVRTIRTVPDRSLAQSGSAAEPTVA